MIEHWRATRAARRRGRHLLRQVSLPRFSWRSWVRHPLSNLHWWWYGWVPHPPDWALECVTVGSVDHESARDADWSWLHVECVRCGVRRDEGAPRG